MEAIKIISKYQVKILYR